MELLEAGDLTERLESLSLQPETASEEGSQGDGPSRDARRPDPSHRPSSKGSRRHADGTAFCEMDGTKHSAPTVDRLATFPAPCAFGAQANLFPCASDAPADLAVHDEKGSRIGAKEFRKGTVILPGIKFDRTPTILKAHRMASLESNDQERDGACSPLKPQDPARLSASERQLEADAIRRRTVEASRRRNGS